MRFLLIISSFLTVAITTLSPDWKAVCGDTERQKILKLLKTDPIGGHINSGVLDGNLTTCSNFHRYVCSKTIAKTSLFQDLFDKIADVEKSCSRYDVYAKFEEDFNFAAEYDSANYTDKKYLVERLTLMPKPVLIIIYEYITLHKANGANFYNLLWYLRAWTPEFDQATFPAKHDTTTFVDPAKIEKFIDTLASDIITIIKTAKGVVAMKNVYLPMLKDYTHTYHLIHVLYREGFETGDNRNRMHNTIIAAVEEYGEVLKEASWSSIEKDGKTRYELFKEFVKDVYATSLKSSLDSMGTKEASLTLPKDFYTYYLEERASLAPLIILPYLRTFIAISRAHQRTNEKKDLDLAIRWKIVNRGEPNIVSGYYTNVLMKNQAIFDLVAMNSPISALYGVMGYVYAHEMYHGVQWQYADFMPDSPVVSASAKCSDQFYATVAERFKQDARFIGWPVEEEADIYGTQIAYKAFVRKIGNKIDERASSTIDLTHRQLFFYANSIYACNVHTGIFNLPYIIVPDSHYKVNGALAQISDFKTAFSCSNKDDMIFEESKMCPTFFGTLSS